MSIYVNAVFGLLLPVLVGLKLAEIIDWPCFWVLTPMWLPTVAVSGILYILGAGALAAGAARKVEVNVKRVKVVSAAVLLIMILCVLLLAASTACAWRGKVVGVHDADTIVVERENGQKAKIRLFGVDAPEVQVPGRWKTQPYARVATDFVRAMFMGEDGGAQVTIFEMGESYGRVVGAVIQLENGLTVQEELVAAGLAWVDPRYCRKSIPECLFWFELEAQARKERRGLWKDDNPAPPWKWRKGLE